MKSRSIIILMILICIFVSVGYAGTWSEEKKVVATYRNEADFMGVSVDVDGDYAVIGARQNPYNTTGGDSLTAAGAAYVYYNNGSTWSLQQKLIASDRAVGDNFGRSVSISGDVVVVAANSEDEDADGNNTVDGAGSAYIFTRSGTTWTQQQKIVATDRASGDSFGSTIAISGNYIIAGSRFQDTDASGSNTLSNAGAAYIFFYNGSTWSQQQKLVASDRAIDDDFGLGVDITSDYAVVGAPENGYDASGSNFLDDAGAIYVFSRSGTTWTQDQKIVTGDRAASDVFGSEVGLQGNYIIAGARRNDTDASGSNTLADAGAAYIFYYGGSSWSQQQKLVASDRSASDNFAIDVDISDTNVVVSSFWEDEDENDANYLENAGSAYIFTRSGSTWSQEQKIVASDRRSGDTFGRAAAIDNGVCISGALRNSYDENDENEVTTAGAAYIFEYAADTPLPVTLASFNATGTSDGIALTWVTESETRNTGFVLKKREKSDEDWQVLAHYQTHDALVGHGTTTAPHHYEHVDENVIPGKTYEYRLGDVDYANVITWHTVLEHTYEGPGMETPLIFGLTKAYPNPFNPSVNIEYTIEVAGNMALSVCDMSGKEIDRLNEDVSNPGHYTAIWRPDNLSTGVYIIKLHSQGKTSLSKVVYLK